MPGACVTSSTAGPIDLRSPAAQVHDGSVAPLVFQRVPSGSGIFLLRAPTACCLFSTCLTDATSTSSSVAVARSGFWTGPFPLRRWPGPCPISQATPFAPSASDTLPYPSRRCASFVGRDPRVASRIAAYASMHAFFYGGRTGTGVPVRW
jgi:hypothetical protein